jgi:hypothetical protein
MIGLHFVCVGAMDGSVRLSAAIVLAALSLAVVVAPCSAAHYDALAVAAQAGDTRESPIASQFRRRPQRLRRVASGRPAPASAIALSFYRLACSESPWKGFRQFVILSTSTAIVAA